MTKAYDLIAIGGGSGGIASARRAAEYGAKVLVIERGPLGGTCVNVGCVPKKVMWHAASLAQGFRDAPDYGFEPVSPAHDWAALVARREAYIRRLNGIYERNLDNKDVTLMRGTGRLTGTHSVRVGEKEMTADRIVMQSAPPSSACAAAQTGSGS